MCASIPTKKQHNTLERLQNILDTHTHTKAERGNQRNKTQEVHMENSMAGAGERDGSGVERTSHSRRGDLSSVPSK